MGILSIILTVIFSISCVLLVLFILIQNQDDGGLGSAFGSNVGKIGGQSGNLLTKITGVLGLSFFLVAGIMSFLNKNSNTAGIIQASKELNGGDSTLKWWESKPGEAKTDATTPAPTAPATDVKADTTTPAETPASDATTPADTTAPVEATPAETPASDATTPADTTAPATEATEAGTTTPADTATPVATETNTAPAEASTTTETAPAEANSAPVDANAPATAPDAPAQ